MMLGMTDELFPPAATQRLLDERSADRRDPKTILEKPRPEVGQEKIDRMTAARGLHPPEATVRRVR